MLAESPFSSSPLSSTALAWFVFVASVALSAGAIPLVAWALRRRLPSARRRPIPLEAVVFGVSPKTRRSSRHAILQHRLLMTRGLVAVLALFLLPGIIALRGLGVAGLQVAVALVVPTLLVALHARRRNA